MFGTTSELLTNSKQTLPKLQHEKPSKYLYNSFFAKGSIRFLVIFVYQLTGSKQQILYKGS